ncbi:MAG: glycoside hydrolase family 38 N-terminal domain-containing protein, partial [Candidatus Hodarchaeales archaeon]
MNNLKEKITFFLVPHTHWDREWYFPFQRFRMNLLICCKILTEYLEINPNYLFTFDGQSIILEDIGEIDQKLLLNLKKFTSDRRIMFGPWYVQPDEFLVSGESLTRNLFIGIKKAKMFCNGNYLQVGYAPDLFGHIPQLGEIFSQYNINHLVFWRGVPDKIENSEFYWITPSSKKILVTSLFQNYSNGFNLPSESNLLETELTIISSKIKRKISTPNFLLMNGTDHELPQISLGELFREKRLINYPNLRIKMTTLDEYSKEVQEFLKNTKLDEKLEETSGELRSCHKAPILSGVLSSRLYLKRENAYLERLLEDYLIPLNSILNLQTGFDFSEKINYLCEKLLENHSHDCICGCSVDEVHEEMEQRFKSIKQMGNEVLKAINHNLSNQFVIQNSFSENKISQLIVINPHSYEFNGFISVQLEPNFTINTRNTVTYDRLKTGLYQVHDLFGDGTTWINFEEEKEIIIKDYALRVYHINRLEEAVRNLSNWFPVNYYIQKKNEKSEFIFEFSKRETKRKIHSKEILELFKDVSIGKNEFIRVIFKSIPVMRGILQVKHLKPFTTKIFSLNSYKQNKKQITIKDLNIKFGPFTIKQLEEKSIHLCVTLGDNEYCVDNLVQFEDLGDRGDEYNFCPVNMDKPITPLFKKWIILEKNHIYLKLKLIYKFSLPESLTL